MKAAGVFALRVLALTLVLIIVFTIASNVAGLAVPSPSTQVASTPTAQAQPAASSGSSIWLAGLRKETDNRRKKP